MNKNWKYGTLNDAVTKGSSNISLNKIKDEDGEYPVFGAKGFVKSVSFFQQDKEYLAIIKDGAGIGRVSKQPKKSSVLATMQYLIPKDGFDIGFIEYFLNSIDFEKHRTGSTIPHIYFKDYKDERFPILPLNEQKRIVAILDEAFAGIDTAIANTEKNLANARELFESYLNSVFSSKGKGWVETKLKNICNIKHGFAFKSQFFVEKSDYVVLTPGSFFESGGFRDQGKKTKYYQGEIPDGYIMEKGNFLIAMTEQAVGLLGSSLIVPESNRYLHNQRLGLVELFDGVEWHNDFFFHQFNTRQFRDAVQATASGVKVRHTSPKKLGEIDICFPSTIVEQRETADKLNDLLEETKRLATIYQQKLISLTELKQSLLQIAFSGELTAEGDKLMDEAVA